MVYAKGSAIFACHSIYFNKLKCYQLGTNLVHREQKNGRHTYYSSLQLEIYNIDCNMFVHLQACGLSDHHHIPPFDGSLSCDAGSALNQHLFLFLLEKMVCTTIRAIHTVLIHAHAC